MKHRIGASFARGLALLAITVPFTGCATLQQLASLPRVDFHIDRTSDASLAGIHLDRVRRVEDLRPTDLLRIASAVSGRRLPLRFDLHVGADNESSARRGEAPPRSSTTVRFADASPNRYDLRLERLEWTLLLEERETVSGVFTRDLVIDAAGTTDIPIEIEVDLLRFFDEGGSDLAALALRAAGAGGPRNVKLRARPTLRTPWGSVRFPNEITIVARDV